MIAGGPTSRVLDRTGSTHQLGMGEHVTVGGDRPRKAVAAAPFLERVEGFELIDRAWLALHGEAEGPKAAIAIAEFIEAPRVEMPPKVRLCGHDHSLGGAPIAPVPTFDGQEWLVAPAGLRRAQVAVGKHERAGSVRNDERPVAGGHGAAIQGDRVDPEPDHLVGREAQKADWTASLERKNARRSLDRLLIVADARRLRKEAQDKGRSRARAVS